ncbi:hypothetical protein [Bacillus sp. NEB1478]|uniref:hypothetical protein n=1 Tax=Bacillus sp. NEB1478 TaxID=3073816 RepID=UPI002873A2AC|nr:hypothetical protein [Bacillus sp. NEB1478]WNB90840.1 hypothetical protein RGB74_13070 [Bacillus sp. NEB1478]
MSTDKVRFSLDIQEDNKIPFYLILVAMGLFLLISITGFFIAHRPQDEINAEYTAQEWSKAVLQSNDPVKYDLLTDAGREKLLDQLRNEKNMEEAYYKFLNYDIIQWKKDRKNMVYKFHYYGLNSCSDCQKDIWVHVVKNDEGWKIPDIHFSNAQAEKFIRNLSGKTVYSSTDVEEEKPLLERIFQKFL